MGARKHIIPVFLPHWGCPYHCVYCNQRAIAQAEASRDIAEEMAKALTKVPPEAHPVEVAFYGGTFTALPLQRQRELLQTVQPFVVKGQVNALRVSTHPACISQDSLELLAGSGVKTVELGVQSLDPAVLQAAGREYGPEVVQDAVERLKQQGFTVGIQLMPGLPGDSKEKALRTVEMVIELKPDFVRVYPTVVIAQTELAQLWQSGKYKALTLSEAVDWCMEISKQFAAAGIPIIRMGLHPSRELEAQILAGPYHPAFKALVDSALALEKIEARLRNQGETLLIRCRPGDISMVRGEKNGNLALLKQKYGFRRIDVQPNPMLGKGEFQLSESPEISTKRQ